MDGKYTVCYISDILLIVLNTENTLRCEKKIIYDEYQRIHFDSFCEMFLNIASKVGNVWKIL